MNERKRKCLRNAKRFHRGQIKLISGQFRCYPPFIPLSTSKCFSIVRAASWTTLVSQKRKVCESEFIGTLFLVISSKTWMHVQNSRIIISEIICIWFCHIFNLLSTSALKRVPEVVVYVTFVQLKRNNWFYRYYITRAMRHAEGVKFCMHLSSNDIVCSKLKNIYLGKGKLTVLLIA